MSFVERFTAYIVCLFRVSSIKAFTVVHCTRLMADCKHMHMYVPNTLSMGINTCIHEMKNENC